MLELKFGQRGLKLLFLVGFCGEFPVSLLARYPGYYDYNRRIVTSLVREGYLKERKFRDYDDHVVRSLSLTKKGMEHIQAEAPTHGELILSHELSPASGQGDWKKTLRLHRSAACFLAAHQTSAAGRSLLITAPTNFIHALGMTIKVPGPPAFWREETSSMRCTS